MAYISPNWKKAKYNPLRVFIPYGKAITVRGTNRYTDLPVNANGLTYDADYLRVNVLANFPNTPTQNNFGVDRPMGHKPGAPVSKHAKGEALDFMIAKYNKIMGIQIEDTEHGQAIFDWLVAQAKDKPLQRENGIAYRGEFRIGQIIYNGKIYRAAENVVRPLRQGSDMHRDHVHVEIVPTRPKPLPVLKRGSTGQEVKQWQIIIGAKVDGQFGPKTEASLKTWQASKGLPVDGIVDEDDWAVLG